MRLTIQLLLFLIPFFSYAQKITWKHDLGVINTDQSGFIEEKWRNFQRQKIKSTTNEDTLVLPVVFHIIHQFGAENISDADVHEALKQLNDGFANSNAFDQGSGVNTNIRFCLVKVDPEGNYTTGINRVYADLSKIIPQIHDQFLKSLINWDPTRYINIWLVKDVQLLEEINECEEEDIDHPGYATMPPAHGSPTDGIVLEAGLARGGLSLIHEMGHYLGLFHTFGGGCPNNDCLIDGDRVCDTPPQSTRAAACNGSSNSCNTDLQSGFTSDQNDLPFNHMDYSGCRHDFTQGQKERMRFMISQVRHSLLGQSTCNVQCSQPTSANFGFLVKDYKIGDSVHFVSSSPIGNHEWLVGGNLFSTNSTLDYMFPRQGWFHIESLIKPVGSPNCNNKQTAWLRVYCAVSARIAVNKIKVQLLDDVKFESTVKIVRPSQDEIIYRWYYNDTLFSNLPSPIHRFQTPGEKTIYLVTQKGTCIDTSNYEWLIVKPLPDYKIELQQICVTAQKTKVNFTICNDGYFDLLPGLPVSFYYQNPLSRSSQRLGDVFYTNQTIGKFCCEPFEVELPMGTTMPGGFLYAVINDDGSLSAPYSYSQFPMTRFFERDYTNNLDSLAFTPFRVAISPKDTMVLMESELSFSSTGNNGYSIQWSTTKGVFSCDTCLSTILLVEGYSQIIATAVSTNGCIVADTAIVKIYIDQDVVIPSAFTPNKDGKNDLIYILSSKQVFRINTLRIYNRWGEKVFERNNFPPNLPEFGWDGRHKGRDAAAAVYVYYFTVDFVNGRRKLYKGTIALIR